MNVGEKAAGPYAYAAATVLRARFVAPLQPILDGGQP
jgi:hypothetical protein